MILNREKKIKAGILLFFALVTLLQLYPLSINPKNSVHDLGDPLLNTWIISWIQQHLFKNPLRLFDANIFYPLSNTLSFSEHLFPQAVLSLPVYFVTKNPILTYNFVFLLSFVLNAYAMFLLVRHLTKNDIAGVAGGIVFAFNTYPLSHLPHLQLLSSWMIPLAFLYLHKFFEEGKFKHSLLFSIFFTLQALSCIYYGLFLISILVLTVPLLIIFNFRKLRPSFFIKLGAPLLFSGFVIFVFSLPYLSLFKIHGFKRELSRGADLINYLAPESRNIFLGKMLSSLGTSERFLFPGIAVLFLAGYCIFQKRIIFKHVPRILKLFLIAVILVCLFILIIIAFTGGFTLDLNLLKISAHNPAKPSFILLLALVVIILYFFIMFLLKKDEESRGNNHFILYFSLFLWSLFLSFGSSFSFLGKSSSAFPLPFVWFYNYFPGFKGIGVPSRYAIFVIFSLAVLAGYGLRVLFLRGKKNQIKAFLAAGLFIFLICEYLTIPQRIAFVPVGEEIPPPYSWLKEQREEFPIVELPFTDPVHKETVYMYFSLFHKKKLVNGFSGFIPSAFDFIRHTFSGFPSPSSVNTLKHLGVKYIIIHPKIWKDNVAKRKMQRINENFSADLKLVKVFRYNLKKPNDILESFGEDFVYEVFLEGEEKKERIAEYYVEIPPSEWEVKAGINEGLFSSLKDDNLETRWATGRPKKTGDFLILEIKEPVRLSKVSFHLGRFDRDYALDIETESSLNGKDWEKTGCLYFPFEFLECLFYSPRNPIQNIYLGEKILRFLKITHMGSDKTYWWSIAELKIYKNQNKSE